MIMRDEVADFYVFWMQKQQVFFLANVLFTFC